MSLVLDASAAAGWLMPDLMPNGAPPGEIADAVGAGPLSAPWLFWVELRNILLVGERRGRLPAGAAEAFLAAVDELGVELDTEASSTRVLDLARRHRLSAYDALYLETALRRGLPLATLDSALAGAARKDDVHVLGGR